MKEKKRTGNERRKKRRVRKNSSLLIGEIQESECGIKKGSEQKKENGRTIVKVK